MEQSRTGGHSGSRLRLTYPMAGSGTLKHRIAVIGFALLLACLTASCNGATSTPESNSVAPSTSAPSVRPSSGASATPTQAALRWSVKVGVDAAVPAFADGTVFVADGHGHLDAFEAPTGHELWSAPVPDGHDVGLPIPMVAGAEVFEQTATALSAFDAASGRRLWTRPRIDYRIVPNGTTGTEENAAGNMIVAGGLVFETSVGQGLVALDARTGAVVWRRPTARTSVGGLATDETTVYIVSGTSSGPPAGFYGDVVVQAFRATDGALVWTRSMPKISVNEVPVVAQGVLFVFTDTGAHSVYALDAVTGTIRYESDAVPHFSSAGISGLIGFGGRGDAVVAFTIRTGAIVWTSHVPRRSAGAGFPAVAGSTVVAAGSVFDAHSGQEIEVLGGSGSNPSNAAVGGGSAFVVAGPDLVAYRLP